jgi:hypothetical protein
LDIRKVTNSNIKVSVFENLDKSKKCRDPLVSLRRRLNDARSLASHTHDSCSATHRWPEHRHGHRPRAVALILAPFFLATMTQGRNHSAIAISHCLPAALSRRALLSPLHRLAANVVPPSPPQAVGHCVTLAPPSSLSEVILKPQLQLSPLRRPPQRKLKLPAFFHHERLDMDRTSSATTDPATTPPSSARVPQSSTSHQSAPSTTGSSPSSSFPIADPRHREQSVLVRLCPPATPNRKPLGLGLVPDPFPIDRRPPAGRILSGIVGVEEGEKSPLLGCRGPKDLMVLTAPVDEAQWHSVIYSFPFGLFISIFKLGFKLLKFIGN